MKNLISKPLFWIVVVAAVAVIGYLLYNKYVAGAADAATGEVSEGTPDTTSVDPGSPTIDAGFAADSPSSVATSQSLPVSFRPYPPAPQNTIA